MAYRCRMHRIDSPIAPSGLDVARVDLKAGVPPGLAPCALTPLESRSGRFHPGRRSMRPISYSRDARSPRRDTPKYLAERMAWLFAALAVFVFAPPAHAQAWQLFSTDTQNNRFEIDVSSIHKTGNYVSSWYRSTLAQDAPLIGTLRHYHSTLVQRLDDCGNGTFVNASVQFLDAHGVVMSSINLAEAQWQFLSPAPGSINQALQRFVCGQIAIQSGLTPSLNVGPQSSVEWKQFGYDAVNKTAWFYSPESVQSDGTLATVVVRSVADTVQFMPPSLAFKFFYARDYFDCSNNMYVVSGGDAYSESGALVYTIHPADKPVLNTSISSGSLVETLHSDLCAGGRVTGAAAAPSPNGQPEIVSGTAWLGPKGYLITAEHVVEGSEKIAIMQGGDVVGSADVVSADPANDVAVLRPRFSRGAHVAMSLSTVPARLGEGVFTLGYPDPDDLGVSLKMTSGEISSLFGEGDDARHLQISIPVQPGNSGGPVVDNSGHVIGIILARLSETADKVTLKNVNYALKADYIRAILGSLPDLGGYSTSQPATSRSQAIISLQGSVYLIVAGRSAKH